MGHIDKGGCMTFSICKIIENFDINKMREFLVKKLKGVVRGGVQMNLSKILFLQLHCSKEVSTVYLAIVIMIIF